MTSKLAPCFVMRLTSVKTRWAQIAKIMKTESKPSASGRRKTNAYRITNKLVIWEATSKTCQMIRVRLLSVSPNNEKSESLVAVFFVVCLILCVLVFLLMLRLYHLWMSTKNTPIWGYFEWQFIYRLLRLRQRHHHLSCRQIFRRLSCRWTQIDTS